MTQKLQSDLERLEAAFHERAAIIYAMAVNKAPIQAEECRKIFEWCAEEVERVRKENL